MLAYLYIELLYIPTKSARFSLDKKCTEISLRL